LGRAAQLKLLACPEKATPVFSDKNVRKIIVSGVHADSIEIEMHSRRWKDTAMWKRHSRSKNGVASLVYPIALVALLGALSAASAEDFHIEEAGSPPNFDVARLKPGTIAFSDGADGAAAAASLIAFADWTQTLPAQKKFLSLYPAYAEPTITKAASADAAAGPVLEKLSVYVAQARFVLERPPGAFNLARYVTLPFLEKIDPAVKHKPIAAGDVTLPEPQGTGNANPDRKWCTGRTTLICIESTYKLEGKIPLGVMLVNKLRDTAKKVPDHIDFEGELSALAPADIDQAGLKELTGLDAAVAGVLEQNIFYVNQIMKFGKLLAVFQNHPTDANKTVVTAYMVLAIDESVLDKKKDFEKVPVLRNLVPAQVLMGQSSFNSGDSISAGLPKYARNEIRTIANLLAADKP
jgi:hypothetical protein